MKTIVPIPPISHDGWQARLSRSAYFLTAVLLHLIIFLMICNWVVFQAPPPHIDPSFQQISIPPKPPPPVPPPPAGGSAANSFEAAVQTAPPPAALSVVTVSSPSNFAVNSVKVQIPNLPASFSAPSGSAMSGHSASGSGVGAGSPFGSADTTGGQQLVGYLYDLKQTTTGQSTGMDPGAYHNKLKQFIAANWDPAVLDPYYKCANPLTTSSIFIPTIKAEDGPKAFGVEKEVQPNMYVVWYKATVAPTQDGTYRFVGTGDDILIVRLNGRTVLDGSGIEVWKSRRKAQKYNMTDYIPTWPGNADFWIGEPFHASAGESMDMDVLIGEEPGGRSNYFLFIQRDESTYEKQPNGTPLLPIFQLDPKPIKLTKTTDELGSFPPYSATPEPWEVAK